jgi:tetratricopeptide (TPR) repeat protein
MKGYTAKDVARMLGLSSDEVRAYARAGLLHPARGPRGEYRFSFQDLVLLRAAKGLEDADVPARRVRSALRKLKEQLPEGYPLSSVQILARGDHVLIRRGEEVWDPESGQAQLDFEVSELAEKAAPAARVAVEEAEASHDPLTAREWYDLGFDLEAASPGEAERAYKKALDLDPTFVDARVNLGRLYHMTGQLNAAEAQFRLALADGPNGTALFNLGVALEDLGRRDEAVQSYREAIDADPKAADAYFNLARLLERDGDKPGAIRCLRTYRRLTEPRQPEPERHH